MIDFLKIISKFGFKYHRYATELGTLSHSIIAEKRFDYFNDDHMFLNF
jgi:hypothetical protein